MPALQFKMDDIEGKEQDLRQYHGNVILMVNVASKCGLTPQYDELQKLYDKYHDQGFEILGFPANNFLGQEPGSDEEIKQFCRKNYGVTFPMFSKISVKGKDKCDLYKYLTDKKADHEHGGGFIGQPTGGPRANGLYLRVVPRIDADQSRIHERRIGP